MSPRQQRTDTGTANAVVRGVNIQAVRNRALAQSYMAYKHVPARVIERVLDHPSLRRQPNAEQAVSEAITPAAAGPPDD
ncbi:MAG: hypothetical protein AB1584_01220 [Pseudomonadota bacterium]